jgi:hypothetical protein
MILDGRNTHRLKSWPEHFAAALSGRKTFEIRLDDRAFSTGDVVVLQEWRPVDQAEAEHKPPGYTGRSVTFLIGYVQRGPVVPPGWCGFELIGIELAVRVGAAVCR